MSGIWIFKHPECKGLRHTKGKDVKVENEQLLGIWTFTFMSSENNQKENNNATVSINTDIQERRKSKMDGKENTKGVNTEEENEDVEDQTDQGGTGDNGDEGNGGGKGGSSNKQEKTFSQDQVSRMMTREKKQGMAAVYKELGIDPKDTKAVNMVKALIASQKSDEQKAAENKVAEQQTEAEANKRVLVAEAKDAAMMRGIKRQYVDDAVALALSKMTDDTDIKTLLGEYKTKYPIWFEDDGEDDDEDGKGSKNDGKAGKDGKGKTGQRGTGSSIKGDNGGKKGKKGGEDEPGAIGKRLAAQRKASAPKKSFWS